MGVAQAAGNVYLARAHWRVIRRLIKGRSAETVERMERKQGLRNG
jgi:hypothetical protein